MRGEVGGGIENEAEIEEKLIARVGRGGEADRVAEDAVRVRDDGEKLGTEFLAGNDGVGYGREVEEGQMSYVWRGDNGVGGDLVEDFWAWKGGQSI